MPRSRRGSRQVAAGKKPEVTPEKATGDRSGDPVHRRPRPLPRGSRRARFWRRSTSCLPFPCSWSSSASIRAGSSVPWEPLRAAALRGERGGTARQAGAGLVGLDARELPREDLPDPVHTPPDDADGLPGAHDRSPGLVGRKAWQRGAITGSFERGPDGGREGPLALTPAAASVATTLAPETSPSSNAAPEGEPRQARPDEAPPSSDDSQQPPEAVHSRLCPRRASVLGAQAAAPARPVTPPPPPLTITEDELTFIKALSAFVPTPRSAKRLANTYRLVRVLPVRSMPM